MTKILIERTVFSGQSLYYFLDRATKKHSTGFTRGHQVTHEKYDRRSGLKLDKTLRSAGPHTMMTHWSVVHQH